MCGISGCALKTGQVGPFLYESLKRLEYRGYDSVGEAAIVDGKLEIRKDRGKIDEVEKKLKISEMGGTVGVGHTRWATHGAPSMENAHPHTDCSDTVAVIHNGIIENFLQLREELESIGHIFKSRTDSEIVAHLVEDNLKAGKKFEDAVRMATGRLIGAYALVFVTSKEPNKIICVRKESPLVLGKGTDGNYCASDIPAFLSKTKNAILMEDDEMAVVTAEYIKLMQVETGEEIRREPFRIEWNVETAVKRGFPHFMLKEIHEQPDTIRDAFRTQPIYLDLMASALNKAKNVFMLACGTSYHACLVASYAFSNLAKLAVTPVVASEFIDGYGALVDSETIVLVVSQSGETADTLTAVRGAKDRGASILGITNVMGSTLTRVSDVYIGQNSGPELGVAATKTFTSQVAVLTKLVLALARKRETLSNAELTRLEAGISALPEMVSKVISSEEEHVKRIVQRHLDNLSFCFLGRGVNVATALEGRLKLLELSYLPAIAYAAGESKHGFIAVIETGFPTIFVTPRDETYMKVIGNVMEMKARGAEIISVIEEGDSEVSKLSDETLRIPSGLPTILSPIVAIIPLQLFAYYMSTAKGYNPDFPRNLAKSVTVL